VKNLAYFFSLSTTLVVFTIAWLTSGFRDFGAAADAPWGPFFWGYVCFAAFAEPILLSESLSRSIEQRTYLSLSVRGCAAGAVICLLASALYILGLRTRGWELMLILLGYGMALGVSVGAVFSRTTASKSKWTTG
jgi:hypothetical protein